MSGEWLSRNPTSRKRSSYDSDWGTYEARAGGGRSSWRGSGSGSGALNRNNIIAEGQRVGVPHDNSHNHNSRQQQQQQPPPQHHQYSSRNQQQQQNNGQPPSSRSIRVADYRGAAARVGTLPCDNPYKRGGFNSINDRGNASNSNDNDVSLFQNEDFLKSLRNPPPITVKLPSNLRSTLNEEQCLVVESILSGHSTFFTGPAGSGKSHVLSTLLKANADGIGGKRMDNHGILSLPPPQAWQLRVMGNEYTKQRWREVDVLVIDEVSMMAASFLDKLSFIASRARNDRRPFGGVQLVVCGDFFQLPPVELSKDGFAFEAKCWSVFRQRGDQTLLNILDEARIGELSVTSAEVLRRHSVLPAAAFAKRSGEEEEQIKPTLLECRNREVDKANQREMDTLPGDVHSFAARDRGINDTYKAQLKHCQAPATLELKVGAQVMLLKNIDLEKGLANGSRGVVVRFQRPHNEKMDFPVVRFDSIRAVGKDCSIDGDDSSDDDNEFVIILRNCQLKGADSSRPAWSISVHKSQGMTIPNLTVNLAGVFEYGQAYVALSRATELNLLTLRGFSEKAFRAHPKKWKGNLNNFDDGIGDLADPFVAPNPPPSQNQTRRSGCTPVNNPNPYTNQRQPPPSYSGNPYNRQQQYQPRPPQPAQFQQRLSPVPQQQQRSPSVSPTLTAEQKRRMEENRKRALAIRMQKQQNS
ncbi:ATP-dependent DNA helicase [Skeletonema marinoi]|uniref:ATP-dependent DNA helicase n=1 Tax=Skeletonema marinoi TaxID=267567 RepID=A0AAD9DDV5_9STRA|nr:ATP-dependent DNA helicase [Skeletonema marinoi]